MIRKFVGSLFSALIMIFASAYSTGTGQGAQPPAQVYVVPPPAQAASPPAALPEFDPERARELSDAGRFLAGLPVGDGPLSDVESQECCRTWARVTRYLWHQHEKARIEKVREWSSEHLSGLDGEETTVFYPFGGPDGLYPLAFFPSAKRYVLVGLEPVGAVPEPEAESAEDAARDLKDMSCFLKPILQISFFRTNDMDYQLEEKGVLPILMVFISGTGHDILDVKKVSIDPEGEIQAWEDRDEGSVSGVKILFRKPGESRTRELLYFSQDLTDCGLLRRPEFVTYAGSLHEPVTYLKAASYLMHKPHFSKIRSIILDNSKAVLEDDSGIPLKFFGQGRWEMGFYGTYSRPIPLFIEWAQPDMWEAFHGDFPPEPLNFGIGYRHRAGDSHLILAIRKPASG